MIGSHSSVISFKCSSYSSLLALGLASSQSCCTLSAALIFSLSSSSSFSASFSLSFTVFLIVCRQLSKLLWASIFFLGLFILFCEFLSVFDHFVYSHVLCVDTVSYTHLTLPTILLVQISVVAVSLKKKKKKVRRQIKDKKMTNRQQIQINTIQ
eukprot:TRINITY_DN420_c0_g1_i8.p1 TRINITY_DN420_c0_g1~~TRINITY_DN420_c0_g1_i8.p1  ORF type:complete len:154 (+),score=13.98 TRINITY_DN420_c0_g1_i8:117-578(+)